jgi:type IV pilus secretin PilQ/predicted competence protein
MNRKHKYLWIAACVLLAISGVPAGPGMSPKSSSARADAAVIPPPGAFSASLPHSLLAASESRVFDADLSFDSLPITRHSSLRFGSSLGPTPEGSGPQGVTPHSSLPLSQPIKLDITPPNPSWQENFRDVAIASSSVRNSAMPGPSQSDLIEIAASSISSHPLMPLDRGGEALKTAIALLGNRAASREAALPIASQVSGSNISSQGAFPVPTQAIPVTVAAVGGYANPSPDPNEQPEPAPFSPSQPPPRFTGKLISLDLRGVDIRDFFRLIHQVSGLNIVVDSDVTGQVTLVLDDVPWDQALDLVLRNNGLGEVLEGNVLRIARVQTLAAEADQTQQLRQAKLQAEPLITVVRTLHYASAEDQQPKLSSGGSAAMPGMSTGGGAGMASQKPIAGVATLLKAAKGVLSSRGSVVADPRDNAVVITDVSSQFPVIDSFIDKLDTKSKQVSIQARVVLASSDFTRSLSSILTGSYHNLSGSTQTAGATGSGVTGTSTLGAPTFTPPATTSSGFGAFAITNAGARYILNAAITAAEEHDQARTISRPTIVTQNNFPGEVMQGVQIPVQTSINLTVTTQYVNAALVLTVTPQVTVDNKVFLDIDVSDDTPGTFESSVGYEINVQEATAKVLVPDGGTVVFGGITVTTRSRSANYIPLIGNIPILGDLFKSSQVSDQNQELLFFVSPTVLPD